MEHYGIATRAIRIARHIESEPLLGSDENWNTTPSSNEYDRRFKNFTCAPSSHQSDNAHPAFQSGK